MDKWQLRFKSESRMLNIWPLIKLDLSVFTLQISLFIVKVTPIAAWLHVELVEGVVGKMAARARLCEVLRGGWWRKTNAPCAS